MTKFEVKIQCDECGHRYKRILKSISDPDPPCPACTKAQRKPRGMDYTSTRAPAAIGGNVQIKAIDETARIVMEDHHMTDMRTDVRMGENAAPRLPPVQQAKADAFFGGPRRKRGGINLGPVAATAVRGGYGAGQGHDPVQMLHERRPTMPIQIVADSNKIKN